MQRQFWTAILSATLVVALPAPGAAQTRSSRQAAASLTKVLEERGLDAIATKDPAHTDRFLAALYYPGAQLLVVSASYAAPAVLEQKIAEKQFRDVYSDIGSAVPATGRCFVMDLEADGLHARRGHNEPFDIVYRNGTEQIAYDGDWKRQQLSEGEYHQRFAKDEAEYVRMLNALTASLKGPTAISTNR